RFHRWTYAAMSVLVECENTRILDNVFDTAVTTAEANAYTFCTGYEATNEGAFYVKNLWVERNVFVNNPRWEGIDCHGGENIWIRDNYVENVRLGIQVGLVTHASDGQPTVLHPVLKNVYIEGNQVIQGAGLQDHYGIVVTGRGLDALAENVRIAA